MFRRFAVLIFQGHFYVQLSIFSSLHPSGYLFWPPHWWCILATSAEDLHPSVTDPQSHCRQMELLSLHHFHKHYYMVQHERKKTTRFWWARTSVKEGKVANSKLIFWIIPNSWSLLWNLRTCLSNNHNWWRGNKGYDSIICKLSDFKLQNPSCESAMAKLSKPPINQSSGNVKFNPSGVDGTSECVKGTCTTVSESSVSLVIKNDFSLVRGRETGSEWAQLWQVQGIGTCTWSVFWCCDVKAKADYVWIRSSRSWGWAWETAATRKDLREIGQSSQRNSDKSLADSVSRCSR